MTWKHLVLRLRLAPDVQLLHPQADAAREAIGEGRFHAEARQADLAEALETLHCRRCLLGHGAESAQQQQEDDYVPDDPRHRDLSYGLWLKV